MIALTSPDLATLLVHARSRIGIPDVTDRAGWDGVRTEYTDAARRLQDVTLRLTAGAGSLTVWWEATE